MLIDWINMFYYTQLSSFDGKIDDLLIMNTCTRPKRM